MWPLCLRFLLACGDSIFGRHVLFSLPSDLYAAGEANERRMVRRRAAVATTIALLGAITPGGTSKSNIKFMEECAKARLVFLHIPKTGGSTVEEQMRAQGCLVGRFGDDGPDGPIKFPYLDVDSKTGKEFTPCSTGTSWWHTPPSWGLLNLSSVLSFTVMRDPIDRFMSALNFGWNHTKHFERTCSGRGCSGAKFNWQLGPDAFVDFYFRDRTPYHSRTGRGKQEVIFDGDCHLVPQSAYLYDRYGNRVQHILRTESLATDLVALAERTGLPLHFPEKVLHSKANTHKAFSKRDLSPRSLETIRNYYAEDVQLLERLAPLSSHAEQGRASKH